MYNYFSFQWGIWGSFFYVWRAKTFCKIIVRVVCSGTQRSSPWLCPTWWGGISRILKTKVSSMRRASRRLWSLWSTIRRFTSWNSTLENAGARVQTWWTWMRSMELWVPTQPFEVFVWKGRFAHPLQRLSFPIGFEQLRVCKNCRYTIPGFKNQFSHLKINSKNLLELFILFRTMWRKLEFRVIGDRPMIMNMERDFRVILQCLFWPLHREISMWNGLSF